MQITVPSNLGANPLYITIGGVSYALGAGETVDVPAEVVAELNRMQANMGLPLAPEVPVPFENKSVAADLNALDAELDARVGALEAIVPELPELPSSDGTYSLQLVMDDGAATLSWEAVEDSGGGGEPQ